MLVPINELSFIPFMLWSLIAGVLFGIIYDVFRIRRIAFRLPGDSSGSRKKSKFAVFFTANIAAIDTVIIFVEDIIFFAFIAAVVALINFKLNFGLPRWYSMAAALGGFTVYHITIGRLVILSADAVIRFIRFVFRMIWKYTVLPAARLIGGTVSVLSEKAELRKRRRYTSSQEKHILRIIEKYSGAQN